MQDRKKTTEQDDAKASTSSRGRSLVEDLRAAAEKVMGPEGLKRLLGAADRAGGVGEQAVAAVLDDVRLIENARYQRARRDAARARAVADKDDQVRADDRVAAVGADLALLRLQRDVARRTVDLEQTEPVGDADSGPDTDKPEPARRPETGVTAERPARPDRRPSEGDPDADPAEQTRLIDLKDGRPLPPTGGPDKP